MLGISAPERPHVRSRGDPESGDSRAKIIDADNPARVLALIEGRGVSIGVPPAGLERLEANPLDVVDSPDLPPLWEVFGQPAHRRALGAARALRGRRAA